MTPPPPPPISFCKLIIAVPDFRVHEYLQIYRHWLVTILEGGVMLSFVISLLLDVMNCCINIQHDCDFRSHEAHVLSMCCIFLSLLYVIPRPCYLFTAICDEYASTALRLTERQAVGDFHHLNIVVLWKVYSKNGIILWGKCKGKRNDIHPIFKAYIKL